MRTIAHISDLHFGREDPNAVEALVEDILVRAPSLIAVSGDLTQRARTREFIAARRFLDRLPFPKVVVPGNHDVPLYNIVRRFSQPLRRFKKRISTELLPEYRDEELVVLGINTARSLTLKNGRVSAEQIDAIRDRFCDVDSTATKVLVTHHQFVTPPGGSHHRVVGRAGRAFAALADCGVDVLLMGHLHQAFSGYAHDPNSSRGGAVVVSQAGTAVSNRSRGEPNSYNFLVIRSDRIEVRVRVLDGPTFVERDRARYIETASTWLPVPSR